MGPGRSLSGTPRWIFAGWSWLEQVGAGWSWFLRPTAYGTVAAQQELPVAASQQGPARPGLGATTAPCGMGQGRHLSRPRRSLQSRRQAYPQSPKWGPGSKGAAPTRAPPCQHPPVLAGPAERRPSLWQPPPCAQGEQLRQRGEPRNTGRDA